MKALALGLIAVPTAGTPVPITADMLADAGGGLPPTGAVYRIDFNARMNTGVTYVKEVATGNIIKALPAPTNGYAASFSIESPTGANEINPLNFSIDGATNNDGIYVTAWVR